MTDADDATYMARALELADRGTGTVEPNPQVGCVVVRDGVIVGEGWHQRYGGPHAEVHALAAAGPQARGATLYVTLEPCCHHGKTPPCTDAVIAAGVPRVVAAQLDPFPQVAGMGVERLHTAGIEVETGLLGDHARRLNAPYLKRVRTGRPWVIAKWAMTLDGKIATHSGDSRWISNERSREYVHRLRGRMDAIIVGRGTAVADDPLLTARPPGQRTAARVVVDRGALLPLESQLVRTARDVPTLVAAAADRVSDDAGRSRCERLQAAGVELLLLEPNEPARQLDALMVELGRRRMTNVLVEGGAALFGALFDAGLIDEVQAFIAPRIVGGVAAPTPLAGVGRELMAAAASLEQLEIERLGGDVRIGGRIGGRIAS
ncbi:MAG TPA: bifunctional diaminohydroxyphosphoribosylaminopyrimidine deaminase/5-amino-6-(5-phosphoribosylamino)uracil reductase RibD [Pirellulaceae bacterium]|nr:bifunctional diaminohydroxyphosphoribosylaminopyrimidine deaminase/5-amino-6-(5-phosphoribosylamino)uracil reductase RibD [Pirellulaceae bacterium]